MRDGINVFPVPQCLAMPVPGAGLEDFPAPEGLHFTSADKFIELEERAGEFTDQESLLMRRTNMPTTVTAGL